MNKTNMLSAQKVKLHGMTSSKWCTKDQIVQYKGLINLYTRDKKILDMDNNLLQKRQTKGLKKLQRSIELDRKNLDNAIRGDKQKLRNSLALHKELQLMFQNSPPQKVIEVLQQVNFTKRKAKDLLKYRLKLKSNVLTDLKLKTAEHEDRLKYEGIQSLSLLPCEKTAYLITGKVQDTILKIEAAIYIRNTYKDIIAIMKKDSIYFDTLLDTLKSDGLKQGKCMLTTTILGQQAAEYVDDRRQEFKYLEMLVKTEMADRKRDLESVQLNVDNFSNNVKQLIRRDSDINMGTFTLEPTISYISLQEDFLTIEKTLKILKDSFSTASVDQLYPFLIQQVAQKERLLNLKDRNESVKEDLLLKNPEAKATYSNLVSTSLDTTASYNIMKVELQNKIDEKITDKDKLEILINDRYKLMAKIRISLNHLLLLSELVNSGDQKPPPRKQECVTPLIPEENEVDPLKIIQELTVKFAKLVNNSKDLLSKEEKQHGYQLFEVMMRNFNKPLEGPVVAVEESLIETEFLDYSVPTFDDIKKQSDEIVASALAALVYKPPPLPRKKRFKF